MIRPGDALRAKAKDGVRTMKCPAAGFFFFRPRCGCSAVLNSTEVQKFRLSSLESFILCFTVVFENIANV